MNSEFRDCFCLILGSTDIWKYGQRSCWEFSKLIFINNMTAWEDNPGRQTRRVDSSSNNATDIYSKCFLLSPKIKSRMNLKWQEVVQWKQLTSSQLLNLSPNVKVLPPVRGQFQQISKKLTIPLKWYKSCMQLHTKQGMKSKTMFPNLQNLLFYFKRRQKKKYFVTTKEVEVKAMF